MLLLQFISANDKIPSHMSGQDLIRRLPDQTDPLTKPWESYVQLAQQYPIGNINSVKQLLTDLNTRQQRTQLEFHLIPVVDGAVSPDVQYDIPHVRATSTGHVVQAVLNRLPLSVRKGIDPKHQVLQIRLDDWKSWDHTMGETTLLSFLINCHQEQEACFLFPDDSNSHTNWGVIQEMYREHFPEK